MKRFFDVILAVIMIAITAIPMCLISLAVKVNSPGPVFHWSQRVGRNNSNFSMPKFRTMRIGTPQLATHLLGEPEKYTTRVGLLLRKYSLDEIPQLYSILKGDMSFVGPRPALFNQCDLIDMRTRCNVHRLLPGLTGIAQTKGRDSISLAEKVSNDYFYLQNHSFYLDLKILLATAVKVLRSEGVTVATRNSENSGDIGPGLS